jgi:predicted esterase YcpF (UPF0227 family)
LDTDLHILYLHGFLSAPQSTKAQQTVAYCEQHAMAGRITVPSMLHGPRQTLAELEAIMATLPVDSLGIIGSSLGGYYATYLAEKYDTPAVLINPAVKPFELWDDYIGEHKNYYSDHVHEVTEEHIEELHALDCTPIRKPENFMVLLQTADEVLDYRLAAEKFAESRLVIHEGGDHSYRDYELELPLIFDFLLSRIESRAR